MAASHDLFLRMGMCVGGVLMSLLTVMMSCDGMLLGLIVFANLVMMRGLMMVMSGSLVMGGGLVVMRRGRVCLVCHLG